jgi:hypothetical protein
MLLKTSWLDGKSHDVVEIKGTYALKAIQQRLIR